MSNYSASETTVDLYIKIDDGYRQYAINPLINVQFANGAQYNYQPVTWLTSQAFVASVPAGTQTAGADARVVAGPRDGVLDFLAVSCGQLIDATDVQHAHVILVQLLDPRVQGV